MTRKQAIEWYRAIQNDAGTFSVRKEYREKFGIGNIAEMLWNDGSFTYGMEYGILIAIAKIFDLTKSDLE